MKHQQTNQLIHRDEIERARQDLLAEIAELEVKLTLSKERQISLQSKDIAPRKNSRRMNPSIDLRKEAQIEVDSYIFTLEFKLTKLHDQIALLNKRMYHAI